MATNNLPLFELCRDWPHEPHLRLGGQAMTDEQLKMLRVVNKISDTPGRQSTNGITVVPEGYDDQDAVLLHYGVRKGIPLHGHLVIERLQELGVLFIRTCLACNLALITDDPDQLVHTGEGLGSFCNDGQNGRLHLHRWEQMELAAAKHMGWKNVPEGIEHEVDFYFSSLGQPWIRIPKPNNTINKKIYRAWPNRHSKTKCTTE